MPNKHYMYETNSIVIGHRELCSNKGHSLWSQILKVPTGREPEDHQSQPSAPLASAFPLIAGDREAGESREQPPGT